MIYLVTGFLYISNLINSLIKKHSKWLPNLLLLLMWILIFGNYQNPDYENYTRNYLYNTTGSDLGYYFITNIFASLGIEYHVFLSIFSMVGILLINSTVRRFVKNTSYVYVLYFIYPFMLDVVQIRNFMAMAIFIFSVPYLLSGRVRDNLKYILLIFIAASMQLTAIVYLPMVLINMVRKNTLIKTIFVTILGFYVVSSINHSWLSIFGDFISNNISDSRLDSWMQVKTTYGFWLYWGMQTCNFLLVLWSKKLFYKNGVSISYESKLIKGNNKMDFNNSLIKINTKNNQEKANWQEKFVILVYWINICAFAYLPFYVFQSTFSRFMRNITILNYIVFCITNTRMNKGSAKKIFYNSIIFVYIIFIFWVEIFWAYSDSILNAIFKYNLFFK